MISRETESTWLMEFDSLTELLQWNRSPCKIWEKEKASNREGKHWAGTRNYDEAVELATDGWHNGARKIKRYTDAFFRKVSSRVHATEIYRTVEPGITFDVGAYCAGAPDHWLSEEIHVVDGLGNRVLVMNCNITASSGVSTETIIARGGVIVATIQALELAGYSVELNMVNRVESSCFESMWVQETHVRLKASDQPINMDELAFALTHPSMLRRIIFRVIEHCPNRALCRKLYYGYGYPADVDKDDQGDIYFPSMRYSDIVWTDEKLAVERILEMLAKQGVDIGHEDTL